MSKVCEILNIFESGRRWHRPDPQTSAGHSAKAFLLEALCWPGVNPLVVELLGVSRKEITGRGWGVREAEGSGL